MSSTIFESVNCPHLSWLNMNDFLNGKYNHCRFLHTSFIRPNSMFNETQNLDASTRKKKLRQETTFARHTQTTVNSSEILMF